MKRRGQKEHSKQGDKQRIYIHYKTYNDAFKTLLLFYYCS